MSQKDLDYTPPTKKEDVKPKPSNPSRPRRPGGVLQQLAERGSTSD